MTDAALSDNAIRLPEDYHIMHGQTGLFTVNFISAHNALHRLTGFKTKDAARAWVAETKLLADKYP